MDAVKLALAPDPPAPSDEELIERMADDDRDALGMLFDRHHQALHGFLSRAYPSEGGNIDDLVQTTFLEAFDAAPRYRRAASPRTWLFAIASNLVKMHRRATHRRARVIEQLAEQPEGSAAPLDARLADQQALARIELAFDELPHDLRVAYAMCVIEGIAVDDAARALGVPRGTIWSRVHRVRQELRLAVEKRRSR
jgi:RNA polymerase sigma-70 factor (ECF subfamily)